MATKKCGCRLGEKAPWSFYQNRSTTKFCSMEFEPLWKAKPASRGAHQCAQEVLRGCCYKIRIRRPGRYSAQIRADHRQEFCSGIGARTSRTGRAYGFDRSN